ncbi:SDR family oxidoreductase [soil metagenome]
MSIALVTGGNRGLGYATARALGGTGGSVILTGRDKTRTAEATDSAQHQFASAAMFEQTFATNLFGAVAVTEAFLPLLRQSPMGRIVNVSTTTGSLTDQADPDSPYYQLAVPAYRSSEAALNSVTLSLAKALADIESKVTSVCPGFVQTDLTPINRDQAPLTADQAAAVVVTSATLPANARSDTFVDRDGPVAW